ncbi:dTMP kinase [Synechococcus sp. MIT S1220]|uniref:dTMP kinase n=1 Tax=Synechococcus sp. MIT S1220 TaxID=3082549 RepID=UPI0039B096AA
MSGRFIVLDGIDGCGKSTQMDHLATWLPASGLIPPGARLIRTREPGGTSLGGGVRELLLHTAAEAAPAPTAELLLYAADRAQHVETLIRPALIRGDWVISDRFSGSTMAYQGYGRGLDRSLIRELERIATGGLSPDVTVLLDLPLKESIRRRRGDQDDRIEAEGELFLQRVQEGFRQLALERRWSRVKADCPIAEVSDALERSLRELLM